MRIYGNDLDPTLKSEVSGYSTTCVSRASCYVSYASLGVAPDRTFVVTWNEVPEWAAGSTATGSYTMQVILKENGEFIYQYKERKAGPNAATGQIGWQLSTSDYAIAGTGFPSTQLAYLFYIPNTGSMTPGAFNAFETATWAGTTTGVITTKIAGTTFGLDVIALTSATPATVHTSFTGAVKVELVNADSSATCSAMTNIQTVAASYTFVAADKGRHRFTGISQLNAYRNVQVRISYPASAPTKVACSTDAFAIRPNSFVVQATDNSWSTAGTNRMLTAATATGTPTHKAGQPFTLTVTPYNSIGNASGNITSNYIGTPVATASCILPASNCVDGDLSVGSFAISSGVATSTTASYSEAGAFSLSVSDATFAQVDAADGTTVSQRTINSSPVSVGRFVPDHFVTSVSSNGTFAHSCSTFTYNGQALNYAVNAHPMLSVTAYNGAVSPSITQNYTGSLNKLTAGSFNLIAPTGDALQKGVDNQNKLQLSATLDTPALSDNGNGTLSLILGNDRYTYSREANALIAPFNNSIVISVSSITDSDGVSASTTPMSLQPAGEPIRYGRIKLTNANGSDLADLQVPMQAEYFDGNNFVTNPLDSCSVAAISFADPIATDALLTTSTCVWDPNNLSGSAKCIGQTPSGEGYVEGASLSSGSFNLFLKAPNVQGSLTVNAAVDNWMRFNWTGAGLANPSVTATFGVYQGRPSVIYMRELY